MIPRPLIRAICIGYPDHTICFRQTPTVYVIVDGQHSVACGEFEKDQIITDAASKGVPVLIVEPIINENTPAK